MRRRGDSVGKLEREIEALRATIADTEIEQGRQAGLAEQSSTERQAAALDPEAFGEATRRAAEHRDERERLALVLKHHANELGRLERELEQAIYQDAYTALESALERQRGASSEPSKKLAEAIEKLPTLEAARDEVRTALARARELLPSEVEFQLPANADEVPFPDGVERLLEFLQRGPERPHAKEAAAVERIRAQGDPDATVGCQAALEALKHKDYERIARLTPGQLAKVVPAAEQLVRTLPQNDREREIVEQRLERVRELVAGEVEAAA